MRSLVDKVSFTDKISPLLRAFPPPVTLAIRDEEVKYTKLIWSRIVQTHYFSNELEILQNERELPKAHFLKSLNPVLELGLLRVGGMLKHSLLSEDEKFPVILPAKSRFTHLIVQYFHHLSLHGGIHLTLTCVRRMFWVIKGRSVVKTFIRNCITCKRSDALQVHQKMGDLPAERVQPARPFSRAGVDYAGPYLLRTSRHRDYKSYKGYFVVFVCLATKAVHLEVVSSYDTESFIGAFRRFVSRRGPCSVLISDRGTNFVGADVELRKMYVEGSEFFRSVGMALQPFITTWQFNPPGAPHFVGIWEAAVRLIKYHLKSVVGETILTYEEFATLLCQVEACLNSRPLTPLQKDTSELFVLTPAHFLIGEMSFLLTEPRIDGNVLCTQRWRRTTQLVQRFWDHWASDYLRQLQKRTKWTAE